MAGVTSARDLGGPLKDSISVRDRINAAKFPARRSTSPGRSFSTSRIPAPKNFRWGVKGAADGKRR